jgi:hypothetical protein
MAAAKKQPSGNSKVRAGTGKKKSAPKNKKKFLWFGMLGILVIATLASGGITIYQNQQMKKLQAAAGGWTSLGKTRTINGPMKHVGAAACKVNSKNYAGRYDVRYIFITGGRVPGNKTNGYPMALYRLGSTSPTGRAGGQSWWNGNLQVVTAYGVPRDARVSFEYYTSSSGNSKLTSDKPYISLSAVKSC